MARFLRAVEIAAWLVGVVLIAWPALAFVLPTELSKWYFDLILTGGSDDPSRFSALPFMWMFMHLPLGVVFVGMGFMFRYSERRDR